MTKNLLIQDFQIEDWQLAIDLWRRVPGMGLSASDGQAEIGVFLQRNPGLSLVVRVGGVIIGTVMAGHDGRRAYIYHACVDPAWQGQGIGRAMMAECLSRLKACGIIKASLYCKADNELGLTFWAQVGWQRRHDLILYSHDL